MFQSSENDSFSPKRVTLARIRRGLSKTELAERVGVTPRMMTEYEAGRASPGPDTLDNLVRVLGFPRRFFIGPEPMQLSKFSVSFRSLASMRASQRNAALGAASIALELNSWIEKQFDLVDVDVPALRDVAPEVAAGALREQWRLGVQPIPSMVHLLELHGIRVFSLQERCRELDAFSFWHGQRPFCFLNTLKSAEHGRFDAAHELGHLVLHRHGHPQGRKAEEEADAFASAFLMPSSTVAALVPRGANLQQLIRLKKTHKVSVAALAHRSHKLGILSEWHYRGLCIEMGRLGYRTNEPSPMQNRETSQVLNKIFTALRQEGIQNGDVAKELRIPVEELEGLVFGLVVTGLDGGGRGGSDRARDLRLVT